MLRILKTGVLGLTMLGVLASAVQPAGAQGFGQPYGGNNGYGQTYAPVGNYGSYPGQPTGLANNPVLQKVLIGGALLGAGFLAGRLTAPRPYPTYNNYPPVQPQFQPSYNGGHHGHHRF